MRSVVLQFFPRQMLNGLDYNPSSPGQPRPSLRMSFTPCLTHHQCQMMIYLWCRRPRLRNRSRLTRRVKPSLFIAPVSVRRHQRRCPSPTALRSCSSCRRRRLLFLRRSRSKAILPCCSDTPQLITSGFLSLGRVMCPSRLRLCSARW